MKRPGCTTAASDPCNERFPTSLCTWNFPLPGPNLTHTDGVNKMAIYSSYNTTNVSDVHYTQVLDMVFSFSPGLWILLFLVYTAVTV